MSDELTMREQETFDKLCRRMDEVALLESAESLLGWDERTMLPAEAGGYRADQIALLSGLVHEQRTHPEVGECLEELSSSSQDDDSDAAVAIREWKRQYDRRVRLPRKLVEELARTSVQAQQAWVESRRQNDYASFSPWLEKTVALKREEADAIGFEDCRYDALLDEYEPRAKSRQVAEILGALRDGLRPLLATARESSRQPREDVLSRVYPVDTQKAFSIDAATRIGFDFQRGRLDVTSHPFCTRLGPNDCRITTRYNERSFSEAFFGTLHEAGHGIYEQGLRVDQYGRPTGSATSLGIHESQSRLWENQVGRSHGFWRHLFPPAKEAFPEALGDVDLETFVACVNAVRPSLIRVEADEATYNMHVVIRFELEQDLIEDRLSLADLPEAWNAKYEENLGIRPPDDADGVLQDIHWSAGLFGYFPTYSLGNLYAAMLYDAARRDLGDLELQFAEGEFTPLRNWLTANVYEAGQRHPAAELVAGVCGGDLTPQPLLTHLEAKIRFHYGH